MEHNAAVTGWGWYTPARVLDNQELGLLVATT